MKRRAICGFAACTLCAAGASGGAMEATVTRQQGDAAIKVEGFYCNIKALTPVERARHMAMTLKLVAKRTQTVEIERGYEFQYRGGSVTVAELAEWAMTESKCCPFFDFHIDLEEEGQLVCLRLTGREGIKKFIRAEFHLDDKS